MNWIIREQQRQESDYNAGSKARMDVDTTLVSIGYKPLTSSLKIDTSQAPLKKIALQFERIADWNNCLKDISHGDIVVVQYPVRNHTIFFGAFLRKLRNKGAFPIGIIHDLESLRQAIGENIPAVSKVRFRLEEISALKYFSKIIVHNRYMKKAIHDLFNIPMDMMVDLEIFDYLYRPESDQTVTFKDGPVIIAGNLDRNKAGYIYSLPSNVIFHLYGANIDESFPFTSNVIYKGKVKPDILPSVLKGSYGLVWDGPTTNSCEGVFGRYLKINNPHKASLYLAAGLPLIVWKGSALADFVQKYSCGINVNTLDNLSQSMMGITDTEYENIAQNARIVGEKIRNGEYLKNAVNIAMKEQS